MAPSFIVATGERVALRKSAQSHGTRVSDNASFRSPKSATPSRITRMDTAAARHCAKQHSRRYFYLLLGHRTFTELSSPSAIVCPARFANAQQLPKIRICDVPANARLRETIPGWRRRCIPVSDLTRPDSGNLKRLDARGRPFLGADQINSRMPREPRRKELAS